jgi:hypothetical protein
MRAAGCPALLLSPGHPRDEIQTFRLGWPDQHDWLTVLSRHFQVSSVGALMARLECQSPEVLTASLCWFMVRPARLVQEHGGSRNPTSPLAAPRQTLNPHPPLPPPRRTSLIAWRGNLQMCPSGAPQWGSISWSGVLSRTRRPSGRWPRNRCATNVWLEVWPGRRPRCSARPPELRRLAAHRCLACRLTPRRARLFGLAFAKWSAKCA